MRNFIVHAEQSHPLLQEMPQEFRDAWFQQYTDNGELLCLGMERIFQDPDNQNSPSADLLTFEIASIQELLEWEEEFGEKPFVALEPDYIFFDELIAPNKAQFSIGQLEDMEFIPDLEIIMTLTDNGVEIDFQDDGEPQCYHKK